MKSRLWLIFVWIVAFLLPPYPAALVAEAASPAPASLAPTDISEGKYAVAWTITVNGSASG